jgi:L-ascorbate metabolism protein UlaG (beta-lactamase superfamily)
MPLIELAKYDKHSRQCITMEFEWLGTSSFRIEMAGTTFITDPGYQHDPNAPVEAEEVDDADFVLVSHGHFDHSADAVPVADASDAPIVASGELAIELSQQGDVETILRNPSAPVDLGTGVAVGLVDVAHSSSTGLIDGNITDTGTPCGFILDDGERTVFHAGETGICANLELVGRVYDPAVAFLPISAGFVMNAEEGGRAAAWTNADVAIPMYHDVPSAPAVDPQDFAAAVDEYASDCEPVLLDPGETVSL